MIVSLDRCACVVLRPPLLFPDECFLEDLGQSVFLEMKATSTEIETGVFKVWDHYIIELDVGENIIVSTVLYRWTRVL